MRNVRLPMLMTRAVSRLSQSLIRRLPYAVFVLSIAALAFTVGFIAHKNKFFPYFVVENAFKTLTTTRAQLLSNLFPGLAFTDYDASDIAGKRIIPGGEAPVTAGGEHFLMSGVNHQYLDYCPNNGCIAVEFARDGKLVDRR